MRESFERASSVIQADKSAMSDGCKALVLQDLKEKFCEFFVLTENPRMQIESVEGGYAVTLTFKAERVKKFNVLK